MNAQPQFLSPIATVARLRQITDRADHEWEYRVTVNGQPEDMTAWFKDDWDADEDYRGRAMWACTCRLIGAQLNDRDGNPLPAMNRGEAIALLGFDEINRIEDAASARVTEGGME